MHTTMIAVITGHCRKDIRLKIMYFLYYQYYIYIGMPVAVLYSVSFLEPEKRRRRMEFNSELITQVVEIFNKFSK